MGRAKPNVSQEEAQSLSLPPGVGLPILLMPQIMGKAAQTKSTEADQKYREAAAIKSPDQEESLYSPVEGGVLGLGGIIASALGVNTRDINAFGQAYAQSKQAVQERKYANKKQKADEKKAQLETEGKIADREAARFDAASKSIEERRRWEIEQADNRALRQAQLKSLEDDRVADRKRQSLALLQRSMESFLNFDGIRSASQIATAKKILGEMATEAGLSQEDFGAEFTAGINGKMLDRIKRVAKEAFDRAHQIWVDRGGNIPKDEVLRFADSAASEIEALYGAGLSKDDPIVTTAVRAFTDAASMLQGPTADMVKFKLREKQLLQLAKMNDARQARWQNITVDNQKWNRFMDTAKLNLDRQKFNLDAQKVMLGESSALNKELVKNYTKSVAEATQGIKGQEAYLEAIRNASDERYAQMQKGNKSLEGLTRDQAMQALAQDIEFAKEMLKNDQDSLDFVQNGGYGGVAGATGGSVGANNANEKPPKWLSKKQLGYWNKGYRPDNPDNPNTTWHGPGG